MAANVKPLYHFLDYMVMDELNILSSSIAMSSKKWYTASNWRSQVPKSGVNVIFTVGDPRFGDLWPEFEAVYH